MVKMRQKVQYLVPLPLKAEERNSAPCTWVYRVYKHIAVVLYPRGQLGQAGSARSSRLGFAHLPLGATNGIGGSWFLAIFSCWYTDANI